MKESKKNTALLRLILFLSCRSGKTVPEICDFLGTPLRTTQRYMADLREVFQNNLEIVDASEHPQRWRLIGQDKSVWFGFNDSDIATLMHAETVLREKNMEAAAGQVENLRLKISSCINVKEVDLEILSMAEKTACRPGAHPKINTEVVETIRRAIKMACAVRVIYYRRNMKKTSELELNPYGILYGERDHYLLAVHADGYKNNEVHSFCLSQIREMEVLENKPFIVDETFSVEEFSKKSFGVWQEEPFEVEWLFSPEVADEAENFVFHPTQKMCRNPDGSLTVTFTAGGALEMDWHLYTWGDKVKVVKPVDFQERVARQKGN